MNTTAQLSNCLLQLQAKSVFAKGYRGGMNRSLYWDATYEDSIDLIAKIPRLAAYIYRNKFHVNIYTYNHTLVYLITIYIDIF